MPEQGPNSMDNTLKLLISVLTIAGVIAMFTPSAPLEPNVEDRTTPVAAASANAMPDKVGEPEVAIVAEEEEEEDPLAGFGEPMNDGKPIEPLEDDASTSSVENTGEPTNDTTPRFSAPSEAPEARAATSGVTAPAPRGRPAPASHAVSNGRPIPGAPKVSRAPMM